MKIAFVYPAYESLAVEYLSAVLKREGHETRLFYDPQLFDDAFVRIPFLARRFARTAQVARSVVDWNPDIVAFSVVTDEYPWFQEVGRRIRELSSVPIITGGIHVTSAPEETLAANSFCNFAMRGEGEEAIVELVDAIGRGKVRPDMPNLVIREGGRIRVNEPRPLIRDLDTIPWADKTMYENTGLYPSDVYTIMTSRGCPYKCSFCNSNLLHRVYEGDDNYLRARSVDDVIAELKWAKTVYRPAVVNFYDEIFAVGMKWFEEFAPRYEKEISIPYMCCVYPSMVNEKRAELLGRSGCVKVDMGVQSVSTQAGKKKAILNRGESNDQVRDAFARLRANRVAVAAENIVNLPGETEDDLVEMARFYNEHRPDVIKFYWLRYYPNTEIVETARQMGYLSDTDVRSLDAGAGLGSVMTGGYNPSPMSRQFYNLFVLIKVLPKKTLNAILDRRLWRFLPPFGFMGVSYAISRMLNRSGANEEAMVRRYLKHYAHHLGLKRFFSPAAATYSEPPNLNRKQRQAA